MDREPLPVKVAGRLMLRRTMGKITFAHIQDMSGQIQIFVADNAPDKETHDAFKHYDIGDIVGVDGVLLKTRTGEVTVRAKALRLLAKSLRPLPEKFHGLADQELRYRQRYVDLIMNEETREVFVQRFARRSRRSATFCSARSYIEVDTPMMQPIPGRRGGAARSSRTTTRSTWTSTCASRRSSISSAWSWAASSRSSRSTATSATRASRRGTIPSSRCSSSMPPISPTST